MHQPYYRDPYTGKLELPWVRLHGLKDYYGMAHVLREFPRFRAVYNLVPSLLTQLEAYLKGSRDSFQDMFRKDAASLEHHEARFLARHFFSANFDHLIKPYPRFLSLFQKRENHKAELTTDKDWRKIFSPQELRDLQVWFSLCSFDEEYKENDDRIRGLTEKGKFFSETDKLEIEAAELELLGKIIPEYRQLSETGQIELSTTPFYHPILPLLIDPQLGRKANPHLPEYPLHFNWPEDARAQLSRSLDYMEKTFGRRPLGVWPSEGSLSTEVLEMMENLGVRWTATDELNLSRSLCLPVERDHHFHVTNPGFLYKPYITEGNRIRLFFRDHHLSDLIGFHYQKMNEKDAARDLAQRLKHCASLISETSPGKEPVVSVILDGENCWEYYPGSGRGFLKEFFRQVQQDDTLEAVTFSDCLNLEPGVIREFSAGSWINGNFDIWIGDEEDRRGWRLIEEARQAFTENRDGLAPELQQEILEYLYIAEGSDWFWWFGKENFTPDLDIFDNLLRRNLQRVYDLLGLEPPEHIFRPVSAAVKKADAEMTAPKSYLSPDIDGLDSHYFEWLNAGKIDVAVIGGAMTISNSLVKGLLYGFDRENLFLRVDTSQKASDLFKKGYRLNLAITHNSVERTVDVAESATQGRAAADLLIECRIPLADIPVKQGESFHLCLEWKMNGEFFQTIPTHGYFTISVPVEREYAQYWIA